MHTMQAWSTYGLWLYLILIITKTFLNLKLLRAHWVVLVLSMQVSVEETLFYVSLLQSLLQQSFPHQCFLVISRLPSISTDLVARFFIFLINCRPEIICQNLSASNRQNLLLLQNLSLFEAGSMLGWFGIAISAEITAANSSTSLINLETCNLFAKDAGNLTPGFSRGIRLHLIQKL